MGRSAYLAFTSFAYGVTVPPGRTIAFDSSKDPFRGIDCPEILLAVSGGKFETLNENFFAFVKTLAKV